MNVLLWVVQVLLALFAIGGGTYKILAYDKIANMPQTAALPHNAWIALGVFEVICGLLLIIPFAKGRFIPIAATGLLIESIALAVIDARYSTEFTAQNPLVWVIVMAIEAAFIAFFRRGQVES
ncbi:MAG TPA: DoxX family protein [Thermoanaerobaculia bacterium]|jgi:uncharacterized membrane protein YphA (DoxX/SURF4 family)|nr:DoxX family protein [Thermoanaerobaculia bacterium]